jgi:hypothetical protein
MLDLVFIATGSTIFRLIRYIRIAYTSGGWPVVYPDLILLCKYVIANVLADSERDEGTSGIVSV